MSKRKKHHEEHADEGWLLPYSDLMTLLLAMFIVLFATSSSDESKFEQMSEAFRAVFMGGTGIMEYSATTPMNEMPFPPTLTEEELHEKVNDFLEESTKKEMDSLEELQKQVDEFIKDKGLSLTLQTKLTEKGLLVTISDVALFESGSATVKQEAVSLAHEISTLLITDPVREVMISGHTDNQPINTTQFQSNWELSAIRSINFLKILLENEQHDPIHFSAIGQGEYRPVETNKTSDGRKKNRRVEVLILPNVSIQE